MDPTDFNDGASGALIPTIKGMAFVPHPLPPRRILDLAPLLPQVARATKALGELSGIGRTLHNPHLLIRPFMRREAVASSKIEGTVTTLTELFLFEVEGRAPAPDDAREVFNYVRALEHALERLNELPISSRLIKEAHEKLLHLVGKSRGSSIVPGEFRTDQNWIGARLIENARYVPPPPREALEAMSDLEKYINAGEDDLPLVIKLALVHYQFEAIHPFPDGNGRVGRLLIPLMLCEQKELSEPLLYLSTFFEKNYEDYIDRMLDVSKYGFWERWIDFFLTGVEETCLDAVSLAQKLLDLQAIYRSKIQKARSSALLGRLIDLLFEHPAATVPYAAEKLGITYNAAKNNVEKLIALDILRPSAGDFRPKFFLAHEIMSLLS
jgi:Fic family protein